MASGITKSNRSARFIALFAVILAAAGALWLFNKPGAAAESFTVAATNCSRFEADARKLFDKGDTAALSGTFAPGDHVHLTIYFTGVRYSWELTGVLAIANKAQVTGAGDFTSVTRSRSMDAPTTISITATSSLRSFGLSVVHDVPAATFRYTSDLKAASHGEINGYARLEMDIDVTTAGDGAIKSTRALVCRCPCRRGS
jgi:hypothetical protein